jgi:hypothetical protein
MSFEAPPMRFGKGETGRIPGCLMVNPSRS